VSLTRPKIPYDDWQCRLGGSPWRVLRFRDISIPVFRYHGDSDKLHRQHFVRMAAYCHLLEKREECRSPYGIVLWHGTYRAVTVPNNPYSRRMFRDVLSLARSCIRDSERDDPILPEPPPESFCWACPLGRPSEYEPGQYFLKHQHPMIPNKCRTPDGRQYHSHCGDRFGWIPPHERAVELDIELGTEAALAL